MLKMKIEMNAPNMITIFRLVCIPIYLVILYINAPWSNIVSWVVFAIASFSDFFDGYLARKYNLVTDFGKIADPVADKILVAAALIALTELGRIPGWVAIVMLSRDFVIGALRDLSASRGQIIAAGKWGKWKTVVQMVAIGCITFYEPLLGLNIFLIGTFIMYVAIALSVYSAYVYIIEFQKTKEA